MSRATSPVRALLISQDVVGQMMAGPGVRYYQLAKALARHVSVTLAIPDTSPEWHVQSDFQVRRYNNSDWHSIRGLAGSADVIVLPSDMAANFPLLANLPAALVIDGYDPLLFEWLSQSENSNIDNTVAQWRDRMVILDEQYGAGDFFICASERQRDWWLGLLEAHGRINPCTFENDRSLRSLVDVVATGVPEFDLSHPRPIIKGVRSGIGQEDVLIVWGGGLWNWLDPLTAVRALAEAQKSQRNLRLIFPGTRRPNPALANITTHLEAVRAMAHDLNLIGSAVFFDDWTPYEDWPHLLNECDIALSLHYDTIETRFAFRTRILDYFAAGIPTIATRGDATSELVAKFGVGLVVGYEDHHAVAEAMLALARSGKQAMATQFARAQTELSWNNCARPLVQFCLNPKRAPDRSAWGAAGVGNPAVVQATNALKQEILARDQQIDYWRDLAHRYENGKLMRVMRRLAEIRGGWLSQ